MTRQLDPRAIKTCIGCVQEMLDITDKYAHTATKENEATLPAVRVEMRRTLNILEEMHLAQ